MSKISDYKRVSLTTISNTVTTSLPSSTSDASSFRFGADFLAASQNKQIVSDGNIERKCTQRRTIRLDLKLFQTDSSAYPEFNYTKLINLETKKLKKAKEKTNGYGDPFDDNEDDVTRIAKELEKKYGNAYGKGRGKKDDFCDIGMGYDESDSFIDNTEAYDEVVPAEVETIEGGFYINCGALEFKSLRPEKPIKTRTDDIIKMPERPRKRILSSSSESDDSESSDEDDEEEEDDDNSDDSDDDETSDESSIKTSKSKDSYASAEKNGKNFNSTIDKENKSIVLTITSSSTSPKPNASDNNSETETKSRFNSIKTITVKDMIKAKRDKFLKARVVCDPNIANGDVRAKSSENDSSSDETSASDDSDPSVEEVPQEKTNNKKPISTNKDNSEKLRSADTKLPKLDDDVASNINEFKELVKSQNWIGKKFQFNDNLTELFLKIDEALMCIDKTQRNMVFAHLEYQLILPKYYFLRKAKQLRIKEEKLKVSRALTKLGKAISEIMPGVISNYEVELQKYTDMQSTVANSDNPPKMPRKKISWNNNLRNLLYEVYQVRWTSYPVLGTRKETLEEFISGFLRSKVIELWPNGWMRYEEIQKEIEKRKNSVKKAKEKEKMKKELILNNSNNITIGTPTHININGPESNINSNTPLVLTISSEPIEKQISNNLKRKSCDASQKQSKTKTQKLSNPKAQNKIKQQITQQHCLSSPIDVALDLCSPSKRVENNLMLSNSNVSMNIIHPAAPNNSSNSAATITPLANKNSIETNVERMSAHIIDLDNYTSTSDILKTTKQLVAARVAAANTDKCETSDEDNGVEFVGIFPAKSNLCPSTINNYKQKTKKHQINNIQGNSRSSSTPNVLNSPLSSLHMEPPNFYAIKTNSNNNCEYEVAQVMKHMEELKRSIASQHQQSTSATTSINHSTSQSSTKSGRDSTHQ